MKAALTAGKTAGIRTGAEYLSGLQDDREVWTKGQRVRDVTREPGMARGAATLASFLDKQHDPALQGSITYIDDDGCLLYTSPSPRDRG